MNAAERYYSMDLLKAAGISFILLWHLQLVNIPLAWTSLHGSIFSDILNIFYFQVVFQAVPIFFLVSFYFLLQKIDTDTAYFKKRLFRISSLYLFWTGAQFFVFLVVCMIIPPVQDMSYKWIIWGGPKLPYVGDSIFYFLSDLMALTCLAFLFSLIPGEEMKKAISVIIITISLAYFEYVALQGIKEDFRSLVNFILYIPTIHLFLRYRDLFLKARYWILAAFIISSVHDILLTNSGILHFEAHAYGRISIYFGALSFFCIVFPQEMRELQAVRYLSYNSLGIFALHKYWFLFFTLLTSLTAKILKISLVLSFSDVSIDFIWLVNCFCTVAFTLITIQVMKKTPFKYFIYG